LTMARMPCLVKQLWNEYGENDDLLRMMRT
jgi:hypothetical protein